MSDEEIKFVDEDLKVESVTAISQNPVSQDEVVPSIDFGNLPPLGGMESIGEVKTGESPGTKVVTQLSEEDTLFLCETAFNTIPQIIWSSLPDRPDKLVSSWNRAFVKYCIKKGIDPMEWLFDEFGLIVCTLAIANSIRTDLTDIKKEKQSIEETKSEKHDNVDYNHAKEIEESIKDSE